MEMGRAACRAAEVGSGTAGRDYRYCRGWLTLEMRKPEKDSSRRMTKVRRMMPYVAWRVTTAQHTPMPWERGRGWTGGPRAAAGWRRDSE